MHQDDEMPSVTENDACAQQCKYQQAVRSINADGVKLIMDGLDDCQRHEIHKLWVAEQTITWIEALGLWMMRMNPDYTAESSRVIQGAGNASRSV